MKTNILVAIIVLIGILVFLPSQNIVQSNELVKEGTQYCQNNAGLDPTPFYVRANQDITGADWSCIYYGKLLIPQDYDGVMVYAKSTLNDKCNDWSGCKYQIFVKSDSGSWIIVHDNKPVQKMALKVYANSFDVTNFVDSNNEVHFKIIAVASDNYGGRTSRVDLNYLYDVTSLKQNPVEETSVPIVDEITDSTFNVVDFFKSLINKLFGWLL